MLMEILTTAKYGLLADKRGYGWILTTSIGPFFLLAPFALMAESLVGPGGRFNQPFFEATGYSNYLGWLIVPLIALNTMNTVFSNVAQRLHYEKVAGTLERILVSMQFPSSMMLGRCLSHGAFLIWFVGVLTGMSFLFLGLEVDADPVSGVMVIAVHLLAVYGMAFAFSSMFLWIEGRVHRADRPFPRGLRPVHRGHLPTIHIPGLDRVARATDTVHLGIRPRT